jgi:hypothetical protein
VQAQKERNVLKHQSTLLMADVIGVGDGKIMRLLQEVEVLKRTLEEEQQRHMKELQELQVYWQGPAPGDANVNSFHFIRKELGHNLVLRCKLLSITVDVLEVCCFVVHLDFGCH